MAFKKFSAPTFKDPSSQRGFAKYEAEPITDSNPGGIIISPQVSQKENLSMEKERLDIQKAKEEQTHNDILKKVLYGDVGDRPNQTFDTKMSEELDNPMGPETEGEVTFRADPFRFSRMKKAAETAPARPPHLPAGRQDQTEAALAFLNEQVPGKIGWDQVINEATKRYKGVRFESDPRFAEIEKNFKANMPPPKKGVWQNFVDKMGGASKFVKDKAGSLSSSPDDAAIDYLKSIGAKNTPANLEWARGKVGK